MAGAGARGAYEAGMLSVLLPELDKKGHRPTMFIGTSAGAINAALFASLAHLSAEDAAAEAVKCWQRMRKSSVMRPLWRSLPEFGVRAAASLLGLPVGLGSFLDTRPLGRTLRDPEVIDWGQLYLNLGNAQVLDTLAVVTTQYTSGSSGRSKVFYLNQNRQPPRLADHSEALDYVPGRITAEHVRASAAIPAVFPPVRLGAGPDARWHIDGGVRLNAPLKPAITLGANYLVLIATDPPRYPAAPPEPASAVTPPMQDVIDVVFTNTLNDRMVSDLQELLRMNRLLANSPGGALKKGSGEDYRTIPVIFGCPMGINELGDVAAQALQVLTHGMSRFTNPDLLLLNFLLGSGPSTRSDLLSYVLFEPEFLTRALTRGQEDAESLLPLQWQQL
jgi:NTE family protein